MIVDFNSFKHRVVLQVPLYETLVRLCFYEFQNALISRNRSVKSVRKNYMLLMMNPSEHKQLKLARSLNLGITDTDLKPSFTERR